MNTRAAIPLMALVERGTHQDAQASVGLRARGFGSTARRVKAAGRDLQVLTQLRDRELGLLRVDPSEHYAWFLAKKAAAFFRMSRSMRNSRLSLRKAASSVRSSVVSRSCPWSDPPGPARPSAERRLGQPQIARRGRDRLALIEDQAHRAGLVGVREAPRVRRALLSAIVAIVFPFGKMSTESDQAHGSRGDTNVRFTTDASR